MRNGKTHFLARLPRKTKTQEELEESKEQKYEAQRQIDVMTMNLENLKNKVRDLESRDEEADANADKLHKLFRLGIIDENGLASNSNMD